MSAVRGNILYNTLLSISQVLFPLVTFPYASRVLGPEAMGAVSFADSFITYLLIFTALGIPLYGIREIAKLNGNVYALGKVFSELTVIHLITSIIGIIVIYLVSRYTERLNSNLALYQIGMAIVLGNVFLAEWFFQGIQKFKYIAIRTIAVRILSILLLFVFVHSPEDKEFYYALNLIAIVISGSLNMFAVAKTARISFKLVSLQRHIKPLLVIFSSSAISTIYLVFDSIILGFLTDDVDVGYYSAAMRISKLSLVVIGVLSAVLLPKLTVAFQEGEFVKAAAMIHKSIDFVLLLSIPIAVGIYCLSEEIIMIFAGTQYINAVPALRILCFIVICLGLAQIFSHQILLPLHREKKVLQASVIGVLVSLALNLTLIPYYKHIGAAVSSFCTELVVTVVLYIYVQKALKIRFPIYQIFQSTVTCCGFFLIKFVVAHFTSQPLMIVIFTVPLSMTVYLMAQVFLWRNKNVIETLSTIPILKSLTP